MQNLIIIIWFFIAIQESINIGTLQKEKKNQETLNNKTNITRKNWTSDGKILNLLRRQTQTNFTFVSNFSP